MKITAIVSALVDAGATPQMILAAVQSAEEQKDAAADASREKARARVAKWRSNHVGNVTERSETSRNGLRAHSETKPKDIDNSKKQTHSADVLAFKAAFAGVCDEGRVEAIIKHRRTKRGQITGHSAALFIADAKAAGLSIPDAIDTCISRNWITVKADWLAPNQRGSPSAASQQAPSMSQLFQAIRDTPHENQPEPPEDRRSIRPAIPHLRAVGSG